MYIWLARFMQAIRLGAVTDMIILSLKFLCTTYELHMRSVQESSTYCEKLDQSAADQDLSDWKNCIHPRWALTTRHKDGIHKPLIYLTACHHLQNISEFSTFLKLLYIYFWSSGNMCWNPVQACVTASSSCMNTGSCQCTRAVWSTFAEINSTLPLLG